MFIWLLSPFHTLLVLLFRYHATKHSIIIIRWRDCLIHTHKHNENKCMIVYRIEMYLLWVFVFVDDYDDAQLPNLKGANIEDIFFLSLFQTRTRNFANFPCNIKRIYHQILLSWFETNFLNIYYMKRDTSSTIFFC